MQFADATSGTCATLTNNVVALWSRVLGTHQHNLLEANGTLVLAPTLETGYGHVLISGIAVQVCLELDRMCTVPCYCARSCLSVCLFLVFFPSATSLSLSLSLYIYIYSRTDARTHTFFTPFMLISFSFDLITHSLSCIYVFVI